MFLNDEASLNGVFINSELRTLHHKICHIWTSTLAIILRKSSYPCRHRYGLEFNMKHKLTTFSPMHTPCWWYRYQSQSSYAWRIQCLQTCLKYTPVSVERLSECEFVPSIILANMMYLAPKIDELRCFVNDNKLGVGCTNVDSVSAG